MEENQNTTQTEVAEVSFRPEDTEVTQTETEVESVPAASDTVLPDTPEKKDTKKQILIILGIVLAVIAICGCCFIPVFQKIRVEKFYETADEFYSTVYAAGSRLETIGKKIGSNWYSHIFDDKFSSIEDAVYSAMDDQEKNIITVKLLKKQIDSMHTKLMKTPDDSELSYVKIKVQKVYSSFNDMYDCVLDVDGSFLTWASAFNNCDDELAQALKELDDAM